MNRTSPQPILCGTDFSAAAALASNVAAAFARRIHAPLLLVHGVDERGEIASDLWPAMMEESRALLCEEAGRLRKTGAEVEAIVAAGVPDDGVVDRAERADARMIVLASASSSAFDRWTLGSVSERVAESAWVPTLVVREPAPLEAWAQGGKPLRIFIGADFTDQSDAAMSWAAQLREIGPCDYTIGFVDRPAGERARRPAHNRLTAAEEHDATAALTRELHARASGILPGQTVHVRVLPAAGRVDKHLLELATEANADLIVVGTHQWRGLSRLRHASLSRRILHAARVNVACVPAHHVVSAASPHISRAHRVLVVTDLSPHDSVAVPYAFSMLAHGGTASFLHIVKQGADVEPKLRQLQALIPTDAPAAGFQVTTEVVAHDNPAAAISDAAHRHQADLICIGAHDFATGPANHLGTTTLAVLTHSACPVLVVSTPPA
jgi:nucleotide-binding universal stress UspA family protein